MLAPEARIARRYPGAVRRVARGACRQSGGGIAAWIQFLSGQRQLAFLDAGWLGLLLREIDAERTHVGRTERSDQAGHDRVASNPAFEMFELDGNIRSLLSREIRVRGNGAVAVGAMACAAKLVCGLLGFGQIGLGGRFLRHRDAVGRESDRARKKPQLVIHARNSLIPAAPASAILTTAKSACRDRPKSSVLYR